MAAYLHTYSLMVYFRMAYTLKAPSHANSQTFLKSLMPYNPTTISPLSCYEAALKMVQYSASNRKQSYFSLYLQRSLNTVTGRLLSRTGLYLCGPC